MAILKRGAWVIFKVMLAIALVISLMPNIAYAEPDDTPQISDAYSFEFDNPLTGGSGEVRITSLEGSASTLSVVDNYQDAVAAVVPYDDAVEDITDSMANRQASFTIVVKGDVSRRNTIWTELVVDALEEDGDPTHGDYLRFIYDAFGGRVITWGSSGEVIFVCEFSVEYKTTTAQEAELMTEVDKVLVSLDLTGKSEYGKISSIYDYICANIEYDYANLDDEAHRLKYTAYAALMDKTAVCQGYASLFYLMAIKSGLSTRIVSGIGNGGPHAWNIVRIGSLYYNLDSTWDATYKQYGQPYAFFLKSEADFGDHIRGAFPFNEHYELNYDSDGFHAVYPMASTSYSAGGGTDPGDDDDGDEPVSISSATIAPIPDQTYTGKAITPKPTVTLAGRALAEGVDYTLSYRNNVGVGTATVTVSGRGAYTGSKSAEFEIVRAAASVKRLAGDTALDTMAKIAAQGFAKGSCDTVVVATMGGYWDALAASSLAGLHGCPVLLTSGSSLSDQAASEIRRLGARRAYIAGGAAAVSRGVESQIRAMGLSTERLAGDTAVGTAVEIYEEGVGSWGRTAVVATARSYHDALAASPYAYAHAAPVFLTDSANELSADALAAVEAGGFESVVICGGRAAVSGSVESQLRGIGVRSVRRLSGDTAYETAAAVSAWALANGMSAACVGVATGRDYYDALTGASLCGRLNAPLVLVGHGNASAAGFLRANRADVSQVYVFGGTAAVTADEYKQVQAAVK